MNYYRRYMGDYAKKTASLSLAEHGAYALLLDHAYATERAIPADRDEVFRLLRAFTTEERKAVEKVLARFWVLGEDGYRNARVDREIRKFNSGIFGIFRALPRKVRNAIQARRRAAKRNAVPLWLTSEQQAQITSLYAEAAWLSVETGIRHEVDHVVPLVSKVVCGLHVPWNLRVVTRRENAIKSNRLVVA